MNELVLFNSTEYWIIFGLLVFSRGADFLSTWIATPNLVLEANPLAKKMGWKWGIVINIILCIIFSFWLLPALVVITTSVLVAARNFQSAWLMRTIGEHSYKSWMSEKVKMAPLGLYLFCLLSQTFLLSLVGIGLLIFSEEKVVPLGIGTGLITYALAVAIYTIIGVWKIKNPEYNLFNTKYN